MSEHIVILGGGFAGWYAANALAPRLRSGNRITLVDRVDHMLYTPMLTEVAGGNLRPQSVAVPMKSRSKRVQVIQAEVKSIDAQSRTVTLADGRVLQATHLVLALGSTTSYHEIEGAKENSIPLKSLADAKQVIAKIDDLLSEAAGCDDPERRRELLTVVVAGGGYTGVETIAAVGEHLSRRAKELGLPASEVRSILIEPTDRLMHETAESLALYSQRHLEDQGVHVMLKTGVKSVQGETVVLSSGEEIKTGLLIWDAGIEPSPLLKTMKIPLGKHGGLEVDSCFQAKNLEKVWGIGDCAEIPQPDGKFYAATAQNATREGDHLAQNISAVIRGDAPRPFRFQMLGQLALLSDRTAVAEILGVKIQGFLAWPLWWVIYLAKLPSMPLRLAAFKDLIRSQRETMEG